MKKTLLIFFLFFFSVALFAQRGTKIYFSPKITLGYTFGAGLNYGTDLSFGLYGTDVLFFGLSFSYYLVNYESEKHRVKSFNLLFETDNIDLKLGAGEVKRKWGYQGRNSASAAGVNLDIAISADKYSLPWLGLRNFFIRKGSWQWYPRSTYVSAYTYFKHQEFYLIDREAPVTLTE